MESTNQKPIQKQKHDIVLLIKKKTYFRWFVKHNLSLSRNIKRRMITNVIREIWKKIKDRGPWDRAACYNASTPRRPGVSSTTLSYITSAVQPHRARFDSWAMVSENDSDLVPGESVGSQGQVVIFGEIVILLWRLPPFLSLASWHNIGTHTG